jgi:2-polyprenyl-3-methyl-5-hydroxy-6-metoxy-1,4-benzoquinol methylase/GNAT superfamily N-acetyltransferase
MVRFEKIPANGISDALLKECQQLFKGHYGCWSSKGAHPGQAINLSIAMLRQYLVGDNAWIATARDNGDLIGYAMVVVVPSPQGPISWVTQLVVHADYQNQLVGSTILNSVWGFSNHYAWGIASANPYAIRALEKATRRRCDPAYIKDRLPTLQRVLRQIPYLSEAPIDLDATRSIVDTGFYQDLSAVPKRLDRVKATGTWHLGNIDEGQEWLAVTFREQQQIRWTDEEFAKFTKASQDIVHHAYERMAAGNPQQNHAWARPKYAKQEIAFILAFTELQNSSVLDFGCGSGRHSIALAEQGFEVLGVDFSVTAIDRARQETDGKNPEFRVADCQTVKLEQLFDLGLCLYDVIGSFPDDAANQVVLRNLIEHVRPGGYVVLSVMSYDYSLQVAKYTSSNGSIQEKLLSLKASNIMQKTGDVFDPDYFLLDKNAKVAYRREIFDEGVDLPVELIVRDRRYGKDEIRNICTTAGLVVELCGYVRAGDFEIATKPDTEPTREILVIARKQLI